MKFFTNQSIWKKIVIVLLIVLLFNTIVVKPVHADVVEFPGKLLSPFLSLLVSFSDGIIELIGRTIMGCHTTLYNIDMVSKFWARLGTILVGLVAAAIAVVAIVLTMGGIAIIASIVLPITATVTVGVGTVVAAGVSGVIAAVWFNDEVLPDSLSLPMYTYSAEEIFKGNILLFDVNFFNPKEGDTYNGAKKSGIRVKFKDGNVWLLKDHEQKDIDKKIAEVGLEYYFYYDGFDDEGHLKEVPTSKQNIASDIQATISSWYYALRNICLVLMLSVLVYIGIRIVLSSVASDKAKYLSMLKDWFVGLCLLFLMHYIMAFSVTLVEKLTDVVKTSVDANGYTVTIEANKKIREAMDENHLNMPEAIQDGYLVWPTNLMGSLRLQLQMEDYGTQYVGLCICFFILCLYTLYFTITYFKRSLYMSFLTLIAPMVAFTYCIDKLNDGQAQGFNKWFKEYIFNLLIQPMHLLLYYILVTSAFELASTNVIYSIVAIAFLTPAEKLLRSLFGFEKSQTAPSMSPAGAVLASSLLSHALSKGQKGNGEGKNRKSDGEKSDKPPIRSKMDPVATLAEGESDDNGQRPDVNNEQEDDDDGLSTGEQAYQDYLNGFQGSSDESNAGGQNPSEGNDELSEEGQAWLDYAQDEDNFMPGSKVAEEVEESEEPETLQTPREQPNESESQQEDSEDKEAQEKNLTRRQRIRNKIGSTKPGKRVLRNIDASIAAQKAAIRNVPKKLIRKLENSHPAKKVGKMAAGLALGTGAAILAGSIAASGDKGFEDVAKVTATAAAGGFAVGSRRIENMKSPSQDEVVQSVHDDAYNKGEHREEAMNDYVKNHRTDPKLIGYLEASFGKDEAQEMLQEGGECEKYFREGITDKDDIKAMHKMKNDGVVKNERDAISIVQLGKQIGNDTTTMGKEKREDWEERLADMALGEENIKDKKEWGKRTLAKIDKWNEYRK